MPSYHLPPHLLRLARFYCLWGVFAFSATILDKEDLKILAQNQYHREFLAHAKDIAPKERDEWWQSTLEQQSLQFLKEIHNGSTPISHQDFQQVITLANWPELYKDEFFQRQLTRVITKYFSQSDTAPEVPVFLKALQSLRSYFPTEQLQLAKVAKKFSLNIEQEVIFFAPLWKPPHSDIYCNHPDSQQFALRWLIYSYQKEQTLTHYMSYACLNVLYPSLLKESFGGDREILVELLLSISEKNLPLKDLRETLAIEALLSSDRPTTSGAKRGFATLKKLKNQSELRQHILIKIMERPYLPDQLWKSYPSESASFFLNELRLNFPEYLKEYANRCLLFRENAQAFPNGNPTKECDLFFQAELSQEEPFKILSEEVKTRYLSSKLPSKE